jgi:peroxiredoxin Q/BCP
MALLAVGDRAPAFRAKDQNGEPVSLSDFAGRRVVLYFYPKDDTPGCTKEACAFRDVWARLKKRKVAVLGVSTDDEKSHEKFARKYSLPFTLVADPDKKIVGDYGVWAEKSMYGRKYMGTLRVTYLIDEKGRIAAVWPKVKPESHAEEILKTIEN